MRVKWKLTVASLKMFFRQREAIIWTLLFPVLMIVLFGLVNFNSVGRLQIGLVREDPGNGTDLAGRLRNLSSVELFEGDRNSEFGLLKKGERDLILVLSAGPLFGAGEEPLSAFVNDASPEKAAMATMIVQNVLDDMQFTDAGRHRFVLHPEKLSGRNLSYIDFLVPGIISMSIMQMGIFGVAFSFVSLKKRGILRRLRVTPVRPNDFILAQILMRLLVVLIQITLLVGIGVLFLKISFVGHLVDMFVIGVLGAFVFLAIGFAIAGISRSEDQVAPLSNVIAMPMILLSGVFFSRSNLPGVVHSVTDVLPLTYLADAMRAITLEGADMTHLLPQLGGLAVWSLIASFLAIRFFRWE